MIEQANQVLSTLETAQVAAQKLGIYQKMKRHPVVAGGLVLAGAGLAYAAVRLVKDSSANKDAKAGAGANAVHLETSVTINRSPGELYGIWRDFAMLPLIMSNLESVTDLGGGKSHWVAKGLAGTKVKWDAETVQDRPNELIAWQSIGDSEVPNAGSVSFKPGQNGRGTTLHVKLDYEPPAGDLGANIAELFGFDPGELIEEDLQRFKQMMEGGEAGTTEEGSGEHENGMAESVDEREATTGSSEVSGSGAPSSAAIGGN